MKDYKSSLLPGSNEFYFKRKKVVGWFEVALAKKKILKGQVGFIDKSVKI